MIDTTFKYVHFGDKFDHEGITYTKTSHSRGFYYENSRIVHKSFRKQSKVKAHDKFYDVESEK
jgi:hypothetical protein